MSHSGRGIPLLFRSPIPLGLVVLIMLTVVPKFSWAQSDGSGQPAPDQASGQDSAPVPNGDQQPPETTGPPTPPYVLNRPIVAVNLPLRVLGGETRSFFLPGAQLSAGTDTNQRDGFGSSDTYGTVRGIGTLSLQKLWSRYDFGADYVGGVAYLGNRSLDRSILQTVHVDQHVSWSTGQVEVRDLFTYLPDGDFGASSYGGTPVLGGLNGGFTGGIIGGSIFSPGQFATLGQQPRINNLLLGDVTQYLSARSSIGAAASYGLTHFTGNKLDLINSWQVASQVSYDYQLNRKDQLAILYAHQTFQYPSSVGNDIESNVVNVLFGRKISGQMEFIAGAGPQFTNIQPPTGSSINRLTVSGRATLKYELRESDFSLSYLRYTTNGSGFFPGATTDIFRLAASHPLSRLWHAQLDVGYNTNHRLESALIPGSANTFDYVLAGVGVHRQLTREISGFVSFLFTNTNFDSPYCLGDSCGKTSQREAALFGLDWHPHPMRID